MRGIIVKMTAVFFFFFFFFLFLLLSFFLSARAIDFRRAAFSANLAIEPPSNRNYSSRRSESERPIKEQPTCAARVNVTATVSNPYGLENPI